MNEREYQRKSGKTTGSNRPIISVVIIVLTIILSIPLAFEAMAEWYKYLPVIILFVGVTVFLARQAFQGLINRHVKIFPQSVSQLSNEAGFVGDKTSNYVSGTAAQIAGGIFLVLGVICLSMAWKYILALLKVLFLTLD